MPYKRIGSFTLLVMLFLLQAHALSASSGSKEYRDPLIRGNRIVVLECDSQKVLRNPLSGWVLYAPQNPPADYWAAYDRIEVPSLQCTVRVTDYAHTLYMRVSWASLNPTEDSYAWQNDGWFRSMIDSARSRNMRLAFRIIVDSRDRRTNSTPDYVKAAGAKGFTSGRNDARWSPYPDDSVFQVKYAKFVAAFAREFNDPDRVDFIDGFGFGKWGEAHSMVYNDPSHRQKVFRWVVDLYTAHFTRIPLAINYHRLVATERDWGQPDSLSEQLLSYAFDKGYILRHDAFGMTGYYQQWERDLAAKWNYRRPIIMEGGWVTCQHTVANDPRRYASVAEVREGEFFDSRLAKVNMMDFRYRETESWFADSFSLVQRFISEGGYRLYPDLISLPTTLRSGKKATISHRWKNRGWGYFPANLPVWKNRFHVAFALLNEKGDVQQVFVDTQLDLSSLRCHLAAPALSFSLSAIALPAGTYRWAVAIVDRTKNNEPGIQLATTMPTSQSGWVLLSKVRVG